MSTSGSMIGTRPFLADFTVLSKSASVSFNSLHGRSAIRVNAENTTPLCEASSLFVVLGSTLSKSVDSFGNGLSIHEGSANTSVNLDTGNNVVSLHDVNKRSSIFSILEESLLVQDSGRDSLVHVRGAEKEFTPLTTVGLFVRNANLLKTLTNSLGRFITSKDTLTISNDSLCGFSKFSGVRGSFLLSREGGQRCSGGIRVWNVSCESKRFLSIHAKIATEVSSLEDIARSNVNHRCNLRG